MTKDRIFNKSYPKVIKEYFTNKTHLISKIDNKQIIDFLEILEKTRKNNKNVYFIGNGGSCSTAEHFEEDLRKFVGIKAYSLTKSPTITMIGNDYGYENIFKKQLELLLEPEEVVVGITGMGNSSNIVEALKYTKEKKGITFGLLGFNGGEARKYCDNHILIPSEDYGQIEDFHLTICHIACKALKI